MRERRAHINKDTVELCVEYKITSACTHYVLELHTKSHSMHSQKKRDECIYRNMQLAWRNVTLFHACMHAYINFKLLIYCMAMKNDFPFMCEGRNKPCNSPFLQEKLTIFQCIFTLLAFLLLNVLNTFSLYCTIILYFQPNVHTLYLQYFISFYYIFRGGCKLFSDVVVSFRL